MPEPVKLSASDIAQVKKLRRADGRRETGLTIVEGYPEVARSLKADVFIHKLYRCREYLVEQQAKEFDQLNVTEISAFDFAQIAFGSRLKGILAVVKYPCLNLSDLKLRSNPFIVVLENVEKPGNIGCVIRSCDGAGVDAVLMCDNKTDIYNHNVVRASIGTVFHVSSVATTREEISKFLKENQIQLIGTSAKTEKVYSQINFKVPSAIIIGNEHDGVSTFWREHVDQMVTIPMLGESSSLNASVSASILIYEALRQRSEV